ANERRRHDVELPPAATITARFAEEAPEHPGGEVQLSNEGTPAHPLLTYTRTAQLDAEGAARFDNVPPGPCTLNWSRGRWSSKLPLAVEAGKSYEVLLGEKEAGDLVDVVGSVVAGGAPVAGQNLRLYGADDRLSDIAETDEAGTFTFHDVSTGLHSMVLSTFSGRPGAPIHYLQIEVEKGMAPLRLDVTAAVVSGLVVSDSGPLVGVAVRAYTVQYPTRVAGLAAFHSAQTAGDGSFRLPWLLQEPALLVFERDGYVTRRIEWRPRGALEDDIGEVRLEPHGGRGRVRFRVLGEAGEEIPRVLIVLHAVDLWAPLQVARIHRTGLNEDLSVEALPTGRYRVFARPGDLGAQEHASEAVEFDHVATAEQEVVVRTRKGGSVTLELRSGDGHVPCPAVVEVLDADGRAALTWRGEQSLVFTGSASLAGLPPGPLTARVTARGWKTLEVPIEVVPRRVPRIVVPIQRE
ncbi:MAG TPA: carboxypeptidase-like regulatory domain-containing protein, partial [Planctomycetota bacterium]|nr:carboxypeptidase-like regulatory domain-containing protein [Planctomycetota bacterium]